ncbi:MAG TPA: hypothetical protein VFW93_06365 [Aquabacterium sp.]|uniref:hypothetical protein n=1 Tax=Aquabacterium sp. TaxID=1872578 RepID=UPI002E36AFD4|nr:hypothetical protein [Aquabacterium sp.]HEX5355820.1 hypothetical protein [Aquabacterium sp.]
MNLSIPLRVAALGALALTMGAAQALADEVPAADAQPLAMPMSLQMRFDPAHLEGGERLGLLSTALLLEAEPGWWMGPAVVGAATGQRGGFFVLGGQIERRWRLQGPWRAQLGLMAGGGGGGGAPVGGGLMVVPAASLLYDWGPVQTGLAWSRVNMPSGRMGSQQIGLVLNWDGRLHYFDAADVGRSSSAPGRTGLGVDRLMLTGAQLHVKARPGQPASNLKLVGVRAEQRAGGNCYWGLEAAAATHGGADGYMELLGTGGWETSAAAIGLDDVYGGVRLSLGLGGGGALDTGGGTLGKAAGVLRWEIGPDAFVSMEAGAVRSGSGAYQAHYAQWQLGWQLDHPGRTSSTRIVGLEWSASLQHVLRAQRKDGRQLDLDTVGIKLKRQLGAQFYLTGQAHSAFSGQAGAYSLGLVGAGWQTDLGSPQWHLGAELLAGAAGGGGVDTEGGAVAQGMVLLGHTIGPRSRLQIGAGRIRSLHGGLSSPVIDVSWTQSFGSGQR